MGKPAALQTQLVENLPEAPLRGGAYSFLRVGRASVNYANHGLHKYPAKFIPQLPRWAISSFPMTGGSVLDPFCGSGTTLLEAALLGHATQGVDISPLAVIISNAKLTVVDEPIEELMAEIDYIGSQAAGNATHVTKHLASSTGKSVLGLHSTWSNWFAPQHAAELVVLRDAIKQSSILDKYKSLTLAVLSTLVKPASFLHEDQIKVRFHADKKTASPLANFCGSMRDALTAQAKISPQLKLTSSSAQVGDAANLPYPGASVERIVTSPPYINAVDYTMAHKYNLFALELIEPDAFKDHCRQYIGVTERAVRAIDLKSCPETELRSRDIVEKLWGFNEPTPRNRAYVVAQYFNGMRSAFTECHRVLVPGGRMFFVIGENNRICGETVPTAEILELIAQDCGLDVENYFYHVIANRSAMRLNRGATGGTIDREVIFVFRRPREYR